MSSVDVGDTTVNDTPSYRDDIGEWGGVWAWHDIREWHLSLTAIDPSVVHLNVCLQDSFTQEGAAVPLVRSS